VKGGFPFGVVLLVPLVAGPFVSYSAARSLSFRSAAEESAVVVVVVRSFAQLKKCHPERSAQREVEGPAVAFAVACFFVISQRKNLPLRSLPPSINRLQPHKNPPTT
jgi:hypothetical protein